MKSRLLEFNDGVMIEVGDPQGPRAEMSARDHVETTMEVMKGMLGQIIAPIGQALHEVKNNLNVPIEVKEAEVELGLSFTAEGNLFVTKATAEGSLKIKILFERSELKAVTATRQGTGK